MWLPRYKGRKRHWVLLCNFIDCVFCYLFVCFQTRSHFEALKPGLALKSWQSWPCFTGLDCTHEATTLNLYTVLFIYCIIILLYYYYHLCVCWCMVRGMNTHHAMCWSVANFTDWTISSILVLFLTPYFLKEEISCLSHAIKIINRCDKVCRFWVGLLLNLGLNT